MSNKKILYILITIILVFNITLLFTPNVYAERHSAVSNDGTSNSNATSEADSDFSFGAILKSVQEFFAKGKEGTNDDDISKTFVEKTAPIFSALYYVGLSVAVGVLIILGIKYATGKPEEKADLKERLIGYTIAVMVLAGAIPIWAFVVSKFSEVTGIAV